MAWIVQFFIVLAPVCFVKGTLRVLVERLPNFWVSNLKARPKQAANRDTCSDGWDCKADATRRSKQDMCGRNPEIGAGRPFRRVSGAGQLSAQTSAWSPGGQPNTTAERQPEIRTTSPGGGRPAASGENLAEFLTSTIDSARLRDIIAAPLWISAPRRGFICLQNAL